MQVPSLSLAFRVVFRRELQLVLRRVSDAANPLVFFVVVIAMFPLGLGPRPELLSLVAPGVVWVVAMLACLLSTDSLFKGDFEDGTLEQMALSAHPLAFLSVAKVIVHWLVTGLPLALVAPVLGAMLYLPSGGTLALFATLLLGTGALSFIGAIGAALTVSLRRGGVLLALVVLPLYVPVLVFGASAVQAAVAGQPVAAPLAVLGAFFLLALCFAPFAIAGALRISLDN